MVMTQTLYKDREKPAASSSSSLATSASSATSTSTSLAASSSSGGKVYLQEAVSAHPLWRDPRFWEESFFEALSFAVSRQRDLDAAQAGSTAELAAHSRGASAARVRRAKEREGQSELATKREAAFAAVVRPCA